MPGGRGLRAPALAGSPRVIGHRDYVTKTILHGLSGPLDGRTYAEVMAPMGASSDRWIADVASFIRNGFGNSSSVVTEADVARVRKETAGREKMWTVEELERTQPRPLVPDITWDATASHNTAAADGAFDYARWSSEAPQQPGMWFSVELPDSVHRDGAAVRVADDRRGTRRRAGGRDVPARLSRRGVERRPDVDAGCGRPRRRPHDRDQLRAGASEVRQDHADGRGEGRRRLVDAAAAPLSTRDRNPQDPGSDPR